jgi:hypothetical protein
MTPATLRLFELPSGPVLLAEPAPAIDAVAGDTL